MNKSLVVRSGSVALLLAALLFSVTAGRLWAQAQNTSQIQGTVTDTTGAAVAGAEVKATQTDTGATRTVTAGADGTYVLANLPIGPYSLEVSAHGFNTYVRTGIVLQVATNPTINVSLQVGAVAQRVEVHANALQASTEATGVGTVMEQQRIVELPLNGRLATDLLQYTPAVIPQGMSGNRGYPGVQSYVVEGGQAFGNSFWLDGSDYNDPYDSGNLAFPFPDALQEFKVETSSLTAQNGVQAGATVTAVTKSGTNSFHGDAFEFFRNGDMNARNYFAPTRDTLKRNQFGGVLGGPIKQNKLFFFFGFQDTITRQDPAQTTSFVPTAAMLQGDFSACPADIPAAVASDFTNDKINPSLYDRASLNLAALLPAGNLPCGATAFGLITQLNQDQYVARVDYTVSEKHSVFGRYIRDHYDRPASYQFTPDNILTTAQGLINDAEQSWIFGDTYLFRPTLVNQFRASVDRLGDFSDGANSVSACDVGVPVYCGYVPHQSGFTVSGAFGVGPGTSGLNNLHSTIPQINDDLSWIRGKHQINIGGGGLMYKMVYYGNVYAQTNWTFPNLAQFLLGQFSSNSMSLPNDLMQTKWDGWLYAQDTWKATPRLTVNAGLRWEPSLPFSEFNGSTYNFSMANMIAGVKQSHFVNAPPGLTYPGDPGFQGKSGMNKDWHLFAPRLAIGYDPTGSGKMVIRSSVGLSYDYVSGGVFVNSADAPPYGGTEIWSGQFSNPFATNPGGNIYPYTVNANAPFAPHGVYIYAPPNISTPEVAQWNLAVQRQFGNDWLASVIYAGSESWHLWTSYQDNPAVYIPGSCVAGGDFPAPYQNDSDGLLRNGPCSSTTNQNNRRVFTLNNYPGNASYGYLDQFASIGTASYNGLTLELQKRLGNGLTIDTNYTWSHCISDLSVGNSTGNAGAGLAIPNDRRYDRSNCQSNEIGGTFSSDRRQIFNFTGIYQTPVLSNHVLRTVASDWNISAIYRHMSAYWVTPILSTDMALNGDAGTERPVQVLADPLCANPRPTCWINPAAFALPAAGTLSPLGRDTIPGPSFFNIDMAIFKDFPIRERQTLEFRVEAFNVTNSFRAGISPPSLSAGASGLQLTYPSSNFGQITSALDPRILQLALKYAF